jgi:hypothetical protein
MNSKSTYLMMMLFICISLFACTTKRTPVKITGINIIEYGIYTKTDSDSQVYAGNNEEDPRIKVNKVTNWKLEMKTDIIPRTQRVSFGVTYFVEGYPEGSKNIPIKIKMVYPKGFEESIVKQHVIGKEHFVGLTFGPQFNYIPGSYGYQFFFKEQKLAEKYFTVYK